MVCLGVCEEERCCCLLGEGVFGFLFLESKREKGSGGSRNSGGGG